MPDTEASRRNSYALNLLLAATALLSAWLLFQVQPMVAKRILPWFGGGAAIWTAAMLFFQAALFVGYLYAHLIARALPPRKQAGLHIALLAAAATVIVTVGVLAPDAWKPTSPDRPALGILVMLAGTVGLPYLMLSATAPLVQVWFSRANPGRSPYRLYAISNIGSLAALLTYPFALEPNLGLVRQGTLWSALFLGFAALCTFSALLSLRAVVTVAESSQPRSLPRSEEPQSEEPAAKPRYLLWLAYPACASVLLLAVTTYITQNVAPIPLLWILPLVVYLLSFILTFDSDRWYRRVFWMPLAGALAFAAVFLWQRDRTPQISWMVGLHTALLFAVSMVCHGELVRLRPAASRLTSYYLSISAGGALGGLFTSLVAPVIFTDYYELHVGLFVAWVLAIVALVIDSKSPFYDGGKGPAFAGLLGIVVMMIGFGVTLYAHVRTQNADFLGADRNFYGALQVHEKSSPDIYYELANGHISHGGQFAEPMNRRVPMWYYHGESGVGKVFTDLKPVPPRRIGLVGLGAGTLATYAESGDHFQFYEINPQVVDFAEKYFTYLQDARDRGGQIDIHVGDARLLLERQEPQNFDVLVVDAFNGDAIPAHLLTMEAIELYLSHLKDDGVLAVHVSNVYLHLEAVVLAAAERFGLEGAHYATAADITPGAGDTTWILLHRREGYFAEKNFGAPLAKVPQANPPVPWTDDYTNVTKILAW
jgi:hypothetical protein